MDSVFNCRFLRRFGVELELNTSNGIVRKLDDRNSNKMMREIPLGSDVIACLIKKTLNVPVEIHKWGATNNNNIWVVKPDGSCGIEICTPILKGHSGLDDLIKTISLLNKSEIKSDGRCSMHVHINVADLTREQLASVFAYYIKCEHVIFDAFPANRKLSRYCQFFGASDVFHCDFTMDADDIICAASTSKYTSANSFHLMKGGGFNIDNNNKKTIEFRLAENVACLDESFARNWIRFLLYFVEITKDLGLPHSYQQGDQFSGLLWLDHTEVFKLLKFDQTLHKDMNEVKCWFINRLMNNGYDSGLLGIWSNNGRKKAREEIINFIENDYNNSLSNYSE